MELRYKINSKILILALIGVVMVCSSYLIYIYDPLQLIVTRMTQLRPGTIFYNVWEVPPYDVLFKVHIFNVTNHEAFLRGEEKLRFEDLGPYIYNEFLENTNATFNDDGTVTFNPIRTIKFDEKRSPRNPFTDRIIVPNIPLVGIQASFNDASFMTNLGFASLARMYGAKAFLNLTVDEYLWGYDDNLVKVANKFIPSWIDFGRFGLLERLFSRDASNWIKIVVDPEKYVSNNTILTDAEKIATYNILEFNGSPGLKEWGYQDPVDGETMESNVRENMIQGDFDGTLFPQNLQPNQSIWLFRKAFCRPVPMQFDKLGLTADGYDMIQYRFSDKLFDTPETNPSNKHYCYKNKCPLKGLGTIAPCYYDIPIVLSNPHFMDADPKINESIDGMQPDPEIHTPYCQIHPKLGVPVGGSLKIQINLDVGQTKYNSLTRPLNDLVLPLFWIELTMAELPSLVGWVITLGCHVGPIAQIVAIYLLGLIGVALISGSAVLILFFSPPTLNGTISLKNQGDYSPLPIISIPAQYFKPEIRICK